MSLNPSHDTRKNIHDRKQAELKVIRTESGREAALNEAKESHKKADKKVKSSIKVEKRNYIDSLATEAQNSANKVDQAAVYYITTQVCGKRATEMSQSRIEKVLYWAQTKNKTKDWLNISIIIIMSVFLERLSTWNMLNCAVQVPIQKYNTHAYKTLKTVGVQITMLKHPAKHKKEYP